MGFNIFILSGNWAFVTRKVDICLLCNSSTSVLISGYIIGSPTRDKAQCLGERPSDKRSGFTPALRRITSSRLFNSCLSKLEALEVLTGSQNNN